MTVCISALAENEKSIVLASDKMVTKQVPPTEYEHDIEKITKVCDNFYVLIAGNVSNALDIVNRAKPKIDDDDSYQEKFEKIKKEYHKFRIEKIETDILQKNGFESLDDFQRKQNAINRNIVQSIHNLIQNADLKVTMILVASENNKFYMKVLLNPGSLVTPLEHAVVGSGNIHADQSLITSGHNKSQGLDSTTYLVFEAKKKAEAAKGVGENTEIIVLSHDENGNISTIDIEDDDLEKLNEVFKEFNNRDSTEIDNALNDKSFSVN